MHEVRKGNWMVCFRERFLNWALVDVLRAELERMSDGQGSLKDDASVLDDGFSSRGDRISDPVSEIS